MARPDDALEVDRAAPVTLGDGAAVGCQHVQRLVVHCRSGVKYLQRVVLERPRYFSGQSVLAELVILMAEHPVQTARVGVMAPVPVLVLHLHEHVRPGPDDVAVPHAEASVVAVGLVGETA